jgi:decaprenyl-phosphate phosphoribosyltransferase
MTGPAGDRLARVAAEPVAARVRRSSASAMVRLMRPRQWIKNGFVLAPLIFSGEFVHPNAVIQALLAFALFCVASSATYIFNDLRDREADAAHPVKSRKRPLASGEVTPKAATTLLTVLYAIVLASFAWSAPTAAVASGYIALNLAYTLKLKHVPVIDIFSLAAGFVFRVYAGAVVLNVPLSSWMLITTLSLALYLGSIKRRDELATSGDASRSVLQFYTLRLLDRYAETAALSAIMFYGLFVVTVRPKLNVTLPFVLFGLFRYWYIAETGGKGESPTDAVWTDPPLIITVILWAGVVVYRLKQAGG